MKRLALITCIAAVVFLIGCGGSSNPIPPVPPPVTGFSNASLSGHYTYQLLGQNANGTFREAGVLTADGAGNLTTGNDDFTQGGLLTTTTFTGTYTINSDGTGTATFNFSNGVSDAFGLALSSSGEVYIMEADSAGNAGGRLELQTTADFVLPTGTFVFEWQGFQSTPNLYGAAGAFTTAGASFSGTEDVDQAGTVTSSVTFSGSFTTPDANGRGTATLGDSTGLTIHFMYYVVNKGSLRLLTSDVDTRLLGRAELQSTGPFSNSSLAGNFAYGSHGDTLQVTGAAQTVGQFTSAGDGTISSGSFDAVQDGNVSSNVTFTGNYIMAPNGRAVVNFNSSSAPVQEIVWLVTPSRAFFLINDPQKVELGTVDKQSAASFSNGDFNGNYAVIMDGFDVTSVVDRVGTIQANGTGGLVLNELVNRAGLINNPGALGGKFSVVAPNGRVLASVNSISNDFIIYLISGTGNGGINAYLLQADNSTEVSGTTAFQVAP